MGSRKRWRQVCRSSLHVLAAAPDQAKSRESCAEEHKTGRLRDVGRRRVAAGDYEELLHTIGIIGPLYPEEVLGTGRQTEPCEDCVSNPIAVMGNVDGRGAGIAI